MREAILRLVEDEWKPDSCGVGVRPEALSAIALRWGDERRFFSERTMSADTVPLGASVSSLEPFHDTDTEAPLSNMEIELAVAEVQAIIRKHSK